eukprot:2484514-Pleurochrysis_carterae.AAC.1
MVVKLRLQCDRGPCGPRADPAWGDGSSFLRYAPSRLLGTRCVDCRRKARGDDSLGFRQMISQQLNVHMSVALSCVLSAPCRLIPPRNFDAVLIPIHPSGQDHKT